MRCSVAALAMGFWSMLACAQTPGARPSPSIDDLVARFDSVYSDPASTDGARCECLLALRAALIEATPAPLSDREKDLIGQRSADNDLVKQTLLGRYVIVLATDAFAKRAAENHFTAVMDLAYLCLKHFWGNDAIARSGNRFLIFADAHKPAGHSCQGLALQIAIGRADADNADWFERFFHEMTHGFQYAHPAGSYFQAGFGEGFAEFCQAVVCEYLAPLGPPFEGRFAWYSRHFPENAGVEYLPTRLPIEEIVAYDPSAGLLMELTNTTLDGRGRPDWRPMRALLQGPFKSPCWVPWRLWPVLMARDCMAAFGREKARPILAKYRFPLDAPALAEVDARVRPDATPWPDPRSALVSWRVLGPVPNPGSVGMDWNPLDVENMSLDPALEEVVRSNPAARGQAWRTDVRCEANGYLHLRDDRSGPGEFFYVVGSLPAGMRGPITLYVSSDDEVALYLDGKQVHLYRGSRPCTPDYPDVAYALADGPGRLVALVVNRGGPAAFSCAVAKGTPFEAVYGPALAGADSADKRGMVDYLGSRRFVSFLSGPILMKALDDPDGSVRAGAARALAGLRNNVPIVDGLVARIGTEKDRAARDVLLDAVGELTFRRPVAEIASQAWREQRDRFASSFYVEAESAWRMGTINAGFFGNNAGAYGGQCVDRGWGSDNGHFFNVVVEARAEGPHVVRFRYAHPADGGKVTVRLRRGTKTVLETEVTLARTKDWTAWRWHELRTPALARGRYYLEFINPKCTPVIDTVGIERR